MESIERTDGNAETTFLDLERKTFWERDAAQNAGALAVDHHQR